VISDSRVASDALPNLAAVGAESIQLLRKQTRRTKSAPAASNDNCILALLSLYFAKGV
jgi:hypothetical protein